MPTKVSKERGKVQKIYKVVKVCPDGTLMSAWVDKDNFAVEYKLNEVTRPNIKGTYLMAFANPEDAYKWIRMSLQSQWAPNRIRNTEHKVYKAIGYNVKKHNGMIPCIMADKVNLLSILAFWKRLITVGTHIQAQPEGSVYCTSMKLRKEVTT